MNRLAWRLATLGGVGLAPFAPGTWGSLVALAGCAAFAASGFALAWLAGALAVAGVPICALAARYARARDPSAVVWDEAAGVALALALVPARWEAWLAAFLLFRLFDITKPFPVGKLERAPGGWGIMLDDLAAGLLAGALVWGASAYVAG